MLIVRSPVRISFGGGGTDLPTYYEKYSGAVLSTTINKYFYTILSRRNDDKIQIISSDLRTIETCHDLNRLNLPGTELEIPLAVLNELQCTIPLDLFLASEIPPGTGLGSSASVCVGLLKALSAYLRLGFSRHQLAETAFHIARHVLGHPVGKQDEYASAFGGLNYITFHPDGSTTVEPVELEPGVLRELESNLMLFFTGTAHNSWEILGEQERVADASSSISLTSLQTIHHLARDMREVIAEGDLHRFGRLLGDAWQAKRRLSSKISNSRIDQLYEMARQHGALGGKITGAGGGGFLLLYCEAEAQPAVREVFAREGLREMTFELDIKGAHVLVNDPFLDGDGRCGLRWTFQSVTGSA
jgi:D-glycero-alpha-D-manno-heptose-7-phosphate kinase